MELLRGMLSDSLEDNVARLQRILNAPVNSDIHFRFFTAGTTRVCAVYMEGMASDRKIGEFILRACAAAPSVNGRAA